ncbi:HAD-IB family hydrolase [Lujinxingia vulgaris]|uniref:HAD-IB family hydrolase n=1 Tax=Lujinxingia vulgaris TaxID=2600176 RepID=A0A5C6XG39_9DELT|nr:HAD-IB family hydrolase [Lujinxingia vulgaris]TXD38373.1 HAD-IB family hydrolase [Lujinxingia vulgaris]
MEPHSDTRRTAAFYDVDGTLIRTNVVHAYAYYAINSPAMGDKIGKTAGLLASLPLYWIADKFDRRVFNEAFYKNYAGFSEDRLVLIGEEIFEKVIKPNIFKGAHSLVERSKRQGHDQILVTGALDVITKPLADFLGCKDFVANRLEIKDGKATGRLLKPMIAGANKALWVRRYAEEHGYDLDRSFAYADSGSDIPLLSVVGNPCAINPDFKMRTTARAYDWPVLNLD